MKTLDLRGQHRSLYNPSSKSPQLVDVPELQFLMLDGGIEKGETPGTSSAFREAIQALYGGAYTLKFMSKRRKTHAVDFPVMALEAIWWVEDGQFDITQPGNWRWRAMIMQPEHITADMMNEALEKLRDKKPSPALDRLRLARYREGLSVQMIHIGPYATEPATVAQMRAFVEEHGLEERHDRVKRRGGLDVYDHHEIYLGDPRRSAPEKLKTILRHPVVQKGKR
jgi:hypothetical protein